MMTMKMIIERVPEEEMRSINVDKLISESHEEKFLRPVERSSTEKYLNIIGETGKKIVIKIFSINGIEEVCLHPYEIVLKKGKAFDWDKLILQVEKILIEILAPNEECTTKIKNKTSFFQKIIERTIVSIKKNQKRCRSFNHNWSQWYDIDKYARYQYQRRDCLNCGKSQSRKFKIK